MIDNLNFRRDGWLNYLPNDDGEGAVATRLRVDVGEINVTRNISKRAGGESEAINVSLLPLAEFFANAWWSLLYEPLKPSIAESFKIRHRLDVSMRGYSFPAGALYSGGDKSIVIDWDIVENPYSNISFLTPRPTEPIQLDRKNTEDSIIDLVESVLERSNNAKSRLRLLQESWNRIKTSMEDPDEFGYCTIAGRLGLDPYDPDTPDLAQLAGSLSEGLLGDLSDAMNLDELGQAVSWLSELEPRLALFPEVSLRDFGNPSEDDLDGPAWLAGENSAIALRENTGFRNEHPKKAVDELLGSAVFFDGLAEKIESNSLTSIVRRLESSARIATIARSARQRRFRACAATYIAWTSMPGVDRATTEAITRRQQASRAFAAEMLAPKKALCGLASRNGFDSDDLEDIASDFICPYPTVMWQAYRAGIPLRGIELPFGGRTRIF